MVIAAQASVFSAPTSAAPTVRGDARGEASSSVKAIDGVGVSSGGAVGGRTGTPGQSVFQATSREGGAAEGPHEEPAGAASTDAGARRNATTGPQPRGGGDPGGPLPGGREPI